MYKLNEITKIQTHIMSGANLGNHILSLALSISLIRYIFQTKLYQ